MPYISQTNITSMPYDYSSFDTSEIETLTFIANLTYEQGGPAVLGARVLLGGDAVEFESKKGDVSGHNSVVVVQGIVPYPNPNRGFVHFRTEADVTAFEFEMFTVSGTKVVSARINAQNIHEGVTLPAGSEGVYFYKITFEDGRSDTGKIIVVKP